MTRLLRQVGDGDREAFDRLFPLVYADLERIASRQLRREHGARTEALAVSTCPVQRDWTRARAWLHKELYPATDP